MSVTIDLDIRAEDVIATLEGVEEQLDRLENDFDFSLDGDFKAQLDDIMDSLDKLSGSLVDDLDEVASRLEDLEIDVGAPVGGGDSGGDTGSDSGDRYTPDDSRPTMGMREILNRVAGSDYSGTTMDDLADADLDFEISRRQRIEGLSNALSDTIGDGLLSGFLTNNTPWAKFTSDRDRGLATFLNAKGLNADNLKFGRLGKSAKRLSGRVSNLRGIIRSAIPSMAKWWQLIALALPALITFGTQAAGVAGAMLAMAGAGAAFIGLGLAGHGNTLAESMENAKLEVRDLKQDLFETFQPSMQTFAPIQGAFFDVLPVRLQKVNDELKQLAGTSYQYALFDALDGATDFAAEFIRTLRDMDGVVSQLSMRFGDIIGSAILDFFEWLVMEAYQNQESLIQLGGVIKSVVEIIYNLSKVFAHLVIIFAPLIDLFAWLTRVLSSPFYRALAAVIVLFGIIGVVMVKTILIISKLRVAMMILGLTGSGAMAGLASSAVGAMATVKGAVMSAVASLGLLQAALVATGIGALIVGGGYLAYQAMKPKGPPSGGGDYSGYTGGGSNTVINEGDTYNFNVDGSTDGPTTEKMMDVAKLNNKTDSTRSLSLSGGNGR
ncbi:tail length tape measure protein [Halorubrum tailed phage 8]|uniref:Tape measure n=3 Tax=Haloferacalesvirus TaxID=2843389 RepID=R4TEZ2_9CAUD|nr:tail length tape measure protein [Halorubrum tailed phage 8]UBF19096.1 tail tape measure protein [Halorubrum phage HRTV-14]UBF19222.1 tail tape measure protein [Halorubrum phage HRTV-17]UBF19349.1 tail tape measure protein [Halorubrum virus HRTV-19]UBF19478.1 tail tape measure protein [Halorubrum virus HRTV-23]AGM10771.1 tape measure [Halorubrum tailed phage 8]